MYRVASSSGPSSASASKPNDLIAQRSLYLLQHAYNPVNWTAWGDAAVEKAVAENKPIFLSIGYAACHWCHVMERESFQHVEIARLLNQYFVCIKVDREERPDVDRFYMTYVQRSTGSGGWPLSLFLTPKLEPIYGGTYFPPESRLGRVGFMKLLQTIHQEWSCRRDELCQEAAQNVQSLMRILPYNHSPSPTMPDTKVCIQAFNHFEKAFEPQYGGFSPRPKFPHPSIMSFLYAYHYYQMPSGKCSALDMCLHTLRKMANGGIHDHVGSGFARYSLDAKWHVPHFEKMLYDQAQIAENYIDAYLLTKDAYFTDVLEDIMKFLTRDMMNKNGGFYGAIDADSLPTYGAEHTEEGACYLWTYDEVKKHIQDPSDFEIFCFYMNIKAQGNVDSSTGVQDEFKNKNVLATYVSDSETCKKFAISEESLKKIVKKCLDLLYEARLQRPQPVTDKKIITSWNGLTISALAKASLALRRQTFANYADTTAEFIRKHLSTMSSGLLRCCYFENDQVVYPPHPILAYMEDHACMIRGLIDLYEATLDCSLLGSAEELQQKQHEKFWDNNYGAYFVSSADDKYLKFRDKDDQDGAEPSGNSISVWNMLRLAVYLNRPELEKHAMSIFRAFSDRLNGIPFAMPLMSAALMAATSGMTQIFIVGSRDDPVTKAMLNVVRQMYMPDKVFAVLDGADGPSAFFYKRNSTLTNFKLVNGKPAAYVCKNFKCMLPITSAPELESALSKDKTRARASR